MDEVDEELLSRAMRARNPAHGKPVLPLTMTEAEMRQKAERSKRAKALRAKAPRRWRN